MIKCYHDVDVENRIESVEIECKTSEKAFNVRERMHAFGNWAGFRERMCV